MSEPAPAPAPDRPTVPAGSAAIVAACLVVVVALGFVVRGHNAITDADADVVQWVAGWRPQWLISVAKAVTLLGDGRAVIALLVLLLGGLLATHRMAWRSALIAPLSLGLGAALVPPLKDAVDRPRPPLSLHRVVESTSGYPSGHSLQAAAAWLALALLLRARGRQRAAIACVAIVVAVGCSRVVLGVHSPTDVLGGWCAGTAVALAVVWCAGRRRPV